MLGGFLKATLFKVLLKAFIAFLHQSRCHRESDANTYWSATQSSWTKHPSNFRARKLSQKCVKFYPTFENAVFPREYSILGGFLKTTLLHILLHILRLFFQLCSPRGFSFAFPLCSPFCPPFCLWVVVPLPSEIRALASLLQLASPLDPSWPIWCHLGPTWTRLGSTFRHLGST